MGFRGQHKNKVCRALGCSEPIKARGCCSRHYARLRLRGSIESNNKASAGMGFLRSLCRGDEDNCIAWPFRLAHTNGYPSLSWRGRSYRAHRVSCRLAHGKPSSPEMHAAHLCGNKECVNPKHLRWSTAKENISDKVRHGTFLQGSRVPTSILDESDILNVVKRLERKETCASIARKFGVSRSTISKIKNGNNWGHISGL